jgi:hypothetical protein
MQYPKIIAVSSEIHIWMLNPALPSQLSGPNELKAQNMVYKLVALLHTPEVLGSNLNTDTLYH